MKTAILISGQCRTLDFCFRSLKEQVLDFFPEADVFISAAADQDASNIIAFDDLPSKFGDVVDQPALDEKDYLAKSLGGKFFIGDGPEDTTAVQRILRQAWHLRRVYEQARDHADYERFIRVRMDQWFHVGCKNTPTLEGQYAMVPWWGSFGGVNDRFAIMDALTAESYCWWPYLDDFLADGCRFHPETLTAWAIKATGTPIYHHPILSSTLKRIDGKLTQRTPEILPDEYVQISG